MHSKAWLQLMPWKLVEDAVVAHRTLSRSPSSHASMRGVAPSLARLWLSALVATSRSSASSLSCCLPRDGVGWVGGWNLGKHKGTSAQHHGTAWVHGALRMHAEGVHACG